MQALASSIKQLLAHFTQHLVELLFPGSLSPHQVTGHGYMTSRALACLVVTLWLGDLHVKNTLLYAPHVASV